MTDAAPKTTAKKTAARRPAPDAIDQLTAALAKPADDAERQKVEAFLDAKIDTLIAERGADRPRNIIEALTEVMRRVSYVGKDSRNSHGNFNFRGIDAVVNALGPAMREVGVIVTPGVARYQYGDVTVGQNRTRQAHVQVEVTYAFHYSNAEGHMTSIEANVAGEAMDSGDKATAKAMSVAMRIALLQTFALPTTEPDPDHYTYERSAAPVTTEGDVYAAVSWAAKESDFEGAFATLRARFGADLFELTLVNKAGEKVRGDKYLEHAEEQTREFRARQAAHAQDAHAEAPQAPPAESAPAQESAPEPARADETVRADAPRPGGNAPAPTQSRDEHESAPAQPLSREEKHLAMVREELAYQAQVLGTPFPAYAADLLDAEGAVDFGKAQKYAVAQRPAVIAALREAGEATVAARYEKYGDSPLIIITQVTGGGDYQREPVGTR